MSQRPTMPAVNAELARRPAEYAASAAAGSARDAEARPRIEVDRPDALADAPVRIRLSGFPADRPVRVEATMHALDGSTWRSYADFQAGADGMVDVSTAAPASGSYAGVSPMGLFWSMERLPGAVPPVNPALILEPWSIVLRAVAAGAQTSPGSGSAQAEATLLRRLAAPGVTRSLVSESGLVGTLFLPAVDASSPVRSPGAAVLVLGGSDGRPLASFAALLASHGYAALALSYFKAPGLPESLAEIPLEYIEGAVRWMRTQPWLGDGFLAVMGRSRGAELALLSAALLEGIDAVVGYSASGLLHGSVEAAAAATTAVDGSRAAWTFRGDPLPWLQEDDPVGDAGAARLRGDAIEETPVYSAWLRNARLVARSAIPVERIAGPVLLVSGADDALWPSEAMSEFACHRLRQHGHPRPVEHFVYPEAGHWIVLPHGPTLQSTAFAHPIDGRRYALGGTPRANAEAAADAWPKVLAFLQRARAAR